MSNYTKSTDFASKDTLPSGDSAKIVRGTEIDAEFEAIETAVASKANTSDVSSTYAPLNSPTFTGSPVLPTGTTAVTQTAGDNDTSVATTAFVATAVAALGYPAFKNRIIDGGFIINQRGYTSGTSLSAGSYGHDRWKAGSGGGTYTFTQGSLGVNTTITITAGTLVQIIEGCNLAEGGTYVLSWTGTAQGRLNGGTYGSSGSVTIIGWTAGTNLNVEFNTGTLGSVQLEKGSTATSFDYRPYGTELALCQRYYNKWAINSDGGGYTSFGSGYVSATTNANNNVAYPVQMRATPTFAQSNCAILESGGAFALTGFSVTYAGQESAMLSCTVASGLTAGRGAVLCGNNNVAAYLTASAEL